MKVKLLHKSTDPKGHSLDELIVMSARVSTDGSDRSPEQLIRHCVTKTPIIHFSIFDQVSLCFQVETSLNIGRQLIRHQSIKLQEFSGRYAEQPETEKIEIRMEHPKNRQSSTIVNHDFDNEIEETIMRTKSLYRKMLDSGVARETARAILPGAMTTRINMEGTLRSWITLLNQRLYKTAQKEAREVAQAIRDILLEEAPITCKAFGIGINDENFPFLNRAVFNAYKKRFSPSTWQEIEALMNEGVNDEY